ncbi:MAG: DUF4363 family protein [Oscillospiraceae bacterium]|nr:DUF4363 family protein [Oscillospiraceae bacterium]
MKRVIISWIILFLIVCYSAAGLYFISFKNNGILPILDELQVYLDTGDNNAAYEAAQRLALEWELYKRSMGILIRDDKLQSIDTSIAKINPYIYVKNTDELYSELQVIRRYIQNLYSSELPMWFNIL